MKRIFYLSSISFFLFSCNLSKEVFYDDAYDEAAAPTLETSGDGYSDLIKDGEKGNQVILEENKPSKQKFGSFISNDDYSGTRYDRNCDCNYGYVRNPRNGTFYYDVFNGRPIHQGSYYHGSFNNYNYCPCNNDYGYLSGWNPCGYGFGYYSGWSYNSWVYNPYGYNLYGSDYLYSYYYGYYPYNTYYNNGYNNGSNSGNGSWFNGNDNNTTGNHYYGHRGSVSTESSNTTSYEHTVKGVATNPDLIERDVVVVSQPISATPTFGIEKKENPTNSYGSTINSGGTVSTTTTNVSTGTRPTTTTTNYSTTSNVVTANVPASNQFGVTSTPQGVSRTGNSTSTTTTNSTPTSSGNNQGTYARYTNTTNTNTSSSENSTTSTSRNGGYTNSTNSTNYNSSSNNSGSNSSSYSSHRSSTSSSSGSSSSGTTSTSGGSGTTSTSRR